MFPIETCPKDGSEFLAYDPVARKYDVCEWWDSVMVGVHQTQSDSEYGPMEDDFWPQRATLWWPLPEV